MNKNPTIFLSGGGPGGLRGKALIGWPPAGETLEAGPGCRRTAKSWMNVIRSFMMTKSHKLKKRHRKLKYLDLGWPPAGVTLEAGPGGRRGKALVSVHVRCIQYKIFNIQ